MKRLPLIFLLISLGSVMLSLADQAHPFRRYALVVGINDGGQSRIKLRYAATDATTFSNVLTELGGVLNSDLSLLKEPTRAQFITALQGLKKQVEHSLASREKPELLVYFSGHSDETGLIFGSEKLLYSDFRKLIDAVPARIRLAVVDACASGALTRIKGGSRLPAFSVDQSTNLSGYAFLTSSSGAESAQESDRIQASYFTHYLISGLRGAADRNQDGKVTLAEAYEYAFQETLAQTQGSQAGAQHPGYDMRLTGSGDLVLTDLRGTSAGIVLESKIQGRIFVRSASGLLVAELLKPPNRKIELGLESGSYNLSLENEGLLYHARVKVDSQVHLPVSIKDFEIVSKEKTRSRGGNDLDTIKMVPSVGPTLLTKIRASLEHLEFGFDEKSMLRSSVLFSWDNYYNYLSFDMKGQSPYHLYGGSFGGGLHIPKKYYFIECDLAAGLLFNKFDPPENFRYHKKFSSHYRLRTLIGYRLFNVFTLFGAITYNAEAWPSSSFGSLSANQESENWGPDIHARRWPGIQLGIRL